MLGLVLAYALSFGILAARRPWLAVVFLAALLPTYGLRFTVAGVPSTILEVTVWAVALGWLVGRWRQSGPPHLPTRPADGRANPFAPYRWPVVLWLLAATAAVAWSPEFRAALGLWKAYFVEPLVTFGLVVLVLRGQPERWRLLDALGVAVVVVSAVAWYQRLTGELLPAPWAATLPRRVTSLYSYPNAVGLFVGPVLAMYLVWLLQDLQPGCSRVGRRLWKLAVAVLGTGAIIFSVTKGAWVGVAVGVVVGALLVFRVHWRRVLTALVSVVVVLALVPAVRQWAVEQAALRSSSGQMRLVVWEETWAFLKDHPFTGAGLAGYQTALEPYHEWWRSDVSPYRLEVFLYPHNVFLNVWTELGLGGLAVFLWLLVAFFRLAWRQRGGRLTVVAGAGMVALLVHGLVDVPYFKNDLAALFWLIAALPLLEPPERALPSPPPV